MQSATAQPIKMGVCIQSALQNKNEIRALHADRLLVGLETKALMAKYFPQLSIDYVYRYNPIISSQIVPIGQFLPVPTDATKAIQFGTQWQQNAGFNLYQPILDASIRSSINESRINEMLKDVDVLKADEALTYEVMKTYVGIYTADLQRTASMADTMRTYKTCLNMQSKFAEGKLLKTELNNSLINHHANISVLKQKMTDLLKQQIYLSFLTGMPLLEVTTKGIDYSIFSAATLFEASNTPIYENLPTIQQYQWQAKLIDTKITNEHRKYIPSLGLQGFLGANQFAEKFAPTLRQSWYASSYVGLQFKMPLLWSESMHNNLKQLHMQADRIQFQTAEEEQRVAKDMAQMVADINSSVDQLQLLAADIALLQENIQLLQYRFEQGQTTAYDVNDAELILQKKSLAYRQESVALLARKLDKLQLSGQLPAYVTSIMESSK